MWAFLNTLSTTWIKQKFALSEFLRFFFTLHKICWLKKLKCFDDFFFLLMSTASCNFQFFIIFFHCNYVSFKDLKLLFLFQVFIFIVKNAWMDSLVPSNFSSLFLCSQSQSWRMSFMFQGMKISRWKLYGT